VHKRKSRAQRSISPVLTKRKEEMTYLLPGQLESCLWSFGHPIWISWL
jgi:hypothetical protein